MCVLGTRFCRSLILDRIAEEQCNLVGVDLRKRVSGVQESLFGGLAGEVY